MGEAVWAKLNGIESFKLSRKKDDGAFVNAAVADFFVCGFFYKTKILTFS